ncbi:DUF2511 domain-containing protein [Streptomyces sp. CB03911]|uniref:DUF2511 domain-containing protein n=1 Tax=Streptomyces sp. CB03911 TaxID=1804758 RepID=UPI00093A48EC|nr:DUF2511 domain-containing protein [Streptomyces sp. CB03911]OKI14188.1 hypothetical protein A6A07_13635 [Streptomyces sp. CB03911]
MTSANISAWPFTVDSGTLRCRAGGVITFEADGKEYAVNGEAIKADYDKDINSVRLPVTMPSGRVVRQKLDSVVTAGEKLCQ